MASFFRCPIIQCANYFCVEEDGSKSCIDGPFHVEGCFCGDASKIPDFALKFIRYVLVSGFS